MAKPRLIVKKEYEVIEKGVDQVTLHDVLTYISHVVENELDWEYVQIRSAMKDKILKIGESQDDQRKRDIFIALGEVMSMSQVEELASQYLSNRIY